MRTNQEVIIVNSDNFVTTNDETEKDKYNSTGNPKNYWKVLKSLTDRASTWCCFRFKMFYNIKAKTQEQL